MLTAELSEQPRPGRFCIQRPAFGYCEARASERIYPRDPVSSCARVDHLRSCFSNSAITPVPAVPAVSEQPRRLFQPAPSEHALGQKVTEKASYLFKKTAFHL